MSTQLLNRKLQKQKVILWSWQILIIYHFKDFVYEHYNVNVVHNNYDLLVAFSILLIKQCKDSISGDMHLFKDHWPVLKWLFQGLSIILALFSFSSELIVWKVLIEVNPCNIKLLWTNFWFPILIKCIMLKTPFGTQCC